MIAFYRPNKNNSGFACSFTDGPECSFASILRQNGWDDNSKTGSFKGSKEDKNSFVNVKLADIELASIIDCIDNNRPFNTFHDSDTPKTIQFIPWMSKMVSENGPEQKGFSFSITVGDKTNSQFKNSFYIGLSFADAGLIKQFLTNCLQNRFNVNRVKYAKQS